MPNRLLFILASLLATCTLAADLPAGSRLPDLSVADKGELVLNGSDVGYQAWSYPQHPGKVHVVQYMAATRSASEINKPFTDQMKTALPQNGEVLSTTILNLDEAMWGTAGLVVSELESNKVEFPRAVLVADADGVGLKQWSLEKDSSAVIVTDAAGVVRFFKQGAMSAAEVASTLALIRQYIDGKSAPAP
jgi:YtfJ family uncharacterized protein